MLDGGIILGWLLHFAVVAVLDVVDVVVVRGGLDLGLFASLGCKLGLDLGLLEVVLRRLHRSGALGLAPPGPRSGGDTGLFLQAGDTVLDRANRAICMYPPVSLLTQ